MFIRRVLKIIFLGGGGLIYERRAAGGVNQTSPKDGVFQYEVYTSFFWSNALKSALFWG